jgi:hypothetical protein
MHSICLDHPLQKWFDFKVPKPSVANNVILNAINEASLNHQPHSKVIWLGKMPKTEIVQKSKKGSKWEVMSFTFQTLQGPYSISIELDKGNWFLNILPKLSIHQQPHLSLQAVKADYEATGLEDFELFWDNKPINSIRKAGLLQV